MKFNQPRRRKQRKNNNNNQYNAKRTYAATLRNQPIEQ